ncbi:hypothetical protein [Nonomuraea sp. NPDC050783]|uniref:hypothetical protein n=1 Tax=Nonomuraea sp. NPDC050783 TaxID=3154634 RepID=UPI003466AB5F
MRDLLASGLRLAGRIAYLRVSPFRRHPFERLGVLRNFHIRLTRLRGRAMPLARYRLGDLVHISPGDCRCGRAATPIVREVLGRGQDRIAGNGGRRHRGDFLTYVAQVSRRRSPGLEVTVRTATRITPEANGKIKIVKALEDRALSDDSATEKGSVSHVFEEDDRPAHRRTPEGHVLR